MSRFEIALIFDLKDFPVPIEISPNESSGLEGGVEVVLLDLCTRMAETNAVSFRVFCFEPWPVDVQNDFSFVLPEIPSVLSNLADRKPCSLQFFEQGIEREICLNPVGEQCSVHVKDMFGKPWKKESFLVDLDEIIEQLRKLLIDFQLISSRINSDAYFDSVFQDWMKTLQI